MNESEFNAAPEEIVSDDLREQMDLNDAGASGTTTNSGQSWFHEHWGIFLTILIFGVFSLDFITGDLWFDELVTLNDFARKDRLREVLTWYPVANNHILYTCILWGWLRVIDFSFSELPLRFPCLIFAVSTLWVLYSGARRIFNRDMAVLLAFGFAVSPVFHAFFYQLRGYSLTILLAALATTGCFAYLQDQRRSALLKLWAGMALLPAVIPVNLLLNFSLLSFLLLSLRRRRAIPEHRNVLVLTGLFSIAGMLIYLPIAGQFIRTISSTRGWESGWLTSGNLGLAFFAHGCLPILAITFLASRQRGDRTIPTTPALSLPLFALCCLVPILLCLLFFTPFPRSFLVYLVPVTFCSFHFYDTTMRIQSPLYKIIVLVVTVNGAFWFHTVERSTQNALFDGKFPQDLIHQYYSRNQDVYRAANDIAQNSTVPDDSIVFINFHLYPTLRHYWVQANLNAAGVECLVGGTTVPLQRDRTVYRSLRRFIIAYNEAQAIDDYKKTFGEPVELRQIGVRSAINLYQVVDPGGQDGG